MSYNLSSSTIGCCGTEVSVDDESAGAIVFYQDIYGTANIGSVTGSLTANDDYVFVISDVKDNAPDISGKGSSSVPYDDKYSFSIASVSAAPEPSTWVLMIAGVGLAGGMLRRRGRFGDLPRLAAAGV